MANYGNLIRPHTIIHKQAIVYEAAHLGFDMVGVVRAQQARHFPFYVEWLTQGLHAGLNYMARPDRVARRADPNVVMPGVRSIIMVGVYYPAALFADALRDPSRGRIAAYAWQPDYHAVIPTRLEQLAARLSSFDNVTGRPKSKAANHRIYVDTGAILERSHAQSAGLGFIGKNTMLIAPDGGSYFLLGALLTDSECDQYDEPARETMCGSCTRCQTACPTNAFPRPYVLDANRCISYHTIENKGVIPVELRAQFGNWIFGCDVCQQVCPFNRFALDHPGTLFVTPDVDRVAPHLIDLLALDADQFEMQFAGTPLHRTGLERLVRNVCIAAGNWGDPIVAAPLLHLVQTGSPLIQEHAYWALHQMESGSPAR